MKKIKWFWMSFETKNLKSELMNYLTLVQAEDFKIIGENKTYTFVIIKKYE